MIFRNTRDPELEKAAQEAVAAVDEMLEPITQVRASLLRIARRRLPGAERDRALQALQHISREMSEAARAKDSLVSVLQKLKSEIMLFEAGLLGQ